MSIRPVTAHQWTCAECHDTGLAHTEAEAVADLDAHDLDYHPEPGALDLDADDVWERYEP